MSSKPITITPTGAVSSDKIVENIQRNLKLITNWFTRCSPHGKPAYICSAGPSLGKFLDSIDEMFFDDNVVICVKHALPEFTKRGLVPHFCSVLDPRPINEVSTLGKVRSDLYNEADPRTIFLVASMTNYSVTEWLIANDKRILGYHTATPEIKDLPPEDRQKVGNFIITGGTSSATRSIEVAHFLGCREIILAGFDSSFESPRPTNIVDIKGKQAYLKVTVGGKPYYTTGELIAQAQDIQSLITNPKAFSEVTLEPGLESSMIDAIQAEQGNVTKALMTLEEILDL